MGKTISELLHESGIEERPSQTKTASATRTAVSEVDEVLRNLGLGDAAAIKTASETTPESNGGKQGMPSMQDIYEQLVGSAPQETDPAAELTNTKLASGNGEPTETTDASESFGELTGHYFEEGISNFIEKVAGEIESSEAKDHKPLEDVNGDGSLAPVIGKEGDPMISMNHQATGAGRIDAMTGNVGPYTLKDKAKAKEYLKRTGSGLVGDFSA